jgi:hypothetical protein
LGEIEIYKKYATILRDVLRFEKLPRIADKISLHRKVQSYWVMMRMAVVNQNLNIHVEIFWYVFD